MTSRSDKACWPFRCGEESADHKADNAATASSQVQKPPSLASSSSNKPVSQRTVEWMVAKGTALASRPWWLVVAGMCLLAALGLGIWAVTAAARSESDTRKTMAWTSANEKALNVEAVITSVFNPAFTLAMLIRLEPFNYTRVQEIFQMVSADVYLQPNSQAIYNIELAPNAIVDAIVSAGKGLPRRIGRDALRPDRREDSIQAINTTSLTIIEPFAVAPGVIALVARYPVFIEDVDVNETFGLGPAVLGTTDGQPVYPTTPCCSTPCSSLAPGNTTPCCSSPTCIECTNGLAPSSSRWNVCSPLNPSPGMAIYAPNAGNCPLSVCYKQQTRTKFWGFSQVLVGWKEIKEISNLYDLCNQFDIMLTDSDGSLLAMCRDVQDWSNNASIILNSSAAAGYLSSFQRHSPLELRISAYENQWTLLVVDQRGWTPVWKAPLIAAVVIICLLFTGLVVLLMASHLEQSSLIKQQKASNKKLAQTTAVLEAEKATTDALIIRQLNLISCFASADVPESKSHSGGSMAGTMSRIEAVRVQLSSGQREADPVKLLTMLGEGSYGKVYKGLWRGTEVAVKTIVLPSNMSGAAKREKMAIMEAAISSSLAHPNVVQTYTYSIRPIRDLTGCQDSEHNPDAELIQTESVGTLKQYTLSEAQRQQETEAQIVSYEVRLVIEYCDKGCLKDALDAGVFFCHSGLNYKAILDTACDIAKAMVHLHMANVLHSDLKARNVMLKSSGQEGRGVCAKVADFGLSISLDSTQTHASSMFQGTMTHMAPEVLMKGHVSKAADVYAFGITMWEILAGESAFKDVPGPHLGHAITALKKRPKFSKAAPRAYVELAQACWSHELEQRPSFTEVLETLQGMRAELPGPTERLHLSVQEPTADEQDVHVDNAADECSMLALPPDPIPAGVRLG